MAEKQYLDTAGLDLVLHALENKFNTKQDTLVVYNAPDDENGINIDDKIILNHINIQKNSTGIIVEAEEVATYNMVNTGASDDFAAVYEFQKITDGHVENICEINIPKDFFLLDVETKIVTSQDKEPNGIFADNDDFNIGDKYIDFTVGIKNGRKTEEKHFYINFTDIMPAMYTGGSAINISEDNKISVLYDEDTLYLKNNKLSIKYDNNIMTTNENGLTVKEADTEGQKGIISLPVKSTSDIDYCITVTSNGTMTYNNVNEKINTQLDEKISIATNEDIDNIFS